MPDLTLDCNQICACAEGNRLEPNAPHVVEHFRGRWLTNFSTEVCHLSDLLATPNPNATAGGVNITALINSYFAPPVILITMVTNIFVCIVLTRRNMVSPTNILLLVMAFVDMITGLLPLPWYLMIAYTKQFLVGRLCSSHYTANFMELMVNTMPTICHTISIWLTVMLAVQRWIYITFPTSVKRICTVRKSIISIAILCVVSTLFYTVTQLLWSGSIYFRMRPATELPDKDTFAVVSCSIHEHRHYYMAAMITRTLLVNIIPSLLLIVITCLLIKGLHRARKRRQQLLRSSNNQAVVNSSSAGASAGSCARRASASVSKKRQDKSSTTLMLVIIMCIFLLVELPMTLIISVYVLMVAEVVSQSAWFQVNSVFPFVNFIILVSYPVNFFIYCLMSTQFRQTFASLFGLGDAAGAGLQQPPSPSAILRRRSECPATYYQHQQQQQQRKKSREAETVALTGKPE